jgi:hypothetical protein
LTKNGLGYILGDFFTNASGHPAWNGLFGGFTCVDPQDPQASVCVADFGETFLVRLEIAQAWKKSPFFNKNPFLLVYLFWFIFIHLYFWFVSNFAQAWRKRVFLLSARPLVEFDICGLKLKNKYFLIDYVINMSH